MPFFGGSQTETSERYFPVSAAEAFDALMTTIPRQFKLKSSDDFTMSITFSSGASAFTWGENFTAQVIPAEGGSNVRVQAAGKVGGQLQQGARTNKLLGELFNALIAELKARRG